MQKKYNSEDVTAKSIRKCENAGTQTCDLFPYGYLFLGMLEQNRKNFSQECSDSRLLPINMLDRYIETCTRVNNFSSKTSKYETTYNVQ